MRLSVECAFPHLGKRGAASRKSAFCTLGLTEKRTLAAPPGRTSRKGAFWRFWSSQNASLREAPHQKAHSGGSGARRVRLSVTSSSRMRFSVKCAFPHLRKRGVASRKSAFWQVGSRKSAFWQAGSRKSAVWPVPAEHASRKSALWPRPGGAPHQKTHSGGSGARRMRLYVTSNPRMRLSVECAFPHLRKRGVASRKSALCALGLTEKRSLARAPRAHLTERRILHMTAHSTSPSGTVELYKPGDRLRAPAAPRPPPALPCDLRTHQCPLARSAARTRAPQLRPTYARKETDHEGIRATA